MKSRRRVHKRHSKKHSKTKHNKTRHLRGGFPSFFKSSNPSSPECDVNNLSSLSKDMGDGQDPVQKMHANYQKCCPKKFGMKNSSPYCKQLKSNFDTFVQYKRDIDGYYGDETDVSKIKEMMNQPINTTQPIVSKPWYKIWGGKRSYKRHK